MPPLTNKQLDKKIATALVSAFHTRGFAYVCGHGVSEEARGAVFEQGFRFMHLPPEKKMKMVCGLDGIDTMGYAYPGMAKVAQNEDVSKVTNSDNALSQTGRRRGAGEARPRCSRSERVIPLHRYVGLFGPGDGAIKPEG